MDSVKTFTDTPIWPPQEFETTNGRLALASITQGDEGSSRDAIILGTDERIRSALIMLTTQRDEDHGGLYLRNLVRAGHYSLKQDIPGFQQLDAVQGGLALAEQCDFVNQASGTGSMIHLENAANSRSKNWAQLLQHTALIRHTDGDPRALSLDFNYCSFVPQGTGSIDPTNPHFERGSKPERIILLSRGLQEGLKMRGDLKDSWIGAQEDLSPLVKEALCKLRNQPPANIAAWLMNHAQNALILGPEFQRHPDYPYANRKPSLSVAVWDIDALTA